MSLEKNGSRRWPAAAAAALAAIVAFQGGPRAVAEPNGPGGTAASAPPFRVTRAQYVVPSISLKDQNGKPVNLSEALTGTEPVALNFFFASCRTICPVMSSAFSEMRKKLGPDSGSIRLVSISIDPEQDTPDVLREYAKRYTAGPGWTFLTGTQDQIDAVLRAFLADSGGKFNHQPLFFFRDPSEGRWLRVDGLAGASDLAAIARSLERHRRNAG